MLKDRENVFTRATTDEKPSVDPAVARFQTASSHGKNIPYSRLTKQDGTIIYS